MDLDGALRNLAEARALLLPFSEVTGMSREVDMVMGCYGYQWMQKEPQKWYIYNMGSQPSNMCDLRWFNHV
jgi:hypothetical protein